MTDGDTVTRRTVLGTIGAGMAGATVLSGGGTASDDRPAEKLTGARRTTRLADRLASDPTNRRAIVRDNAGGVIGQLRDRSVLSGGIEAFDFEQFDADRGRIDEQSAFEGTAVTTIEVDGEATTLVIASAYDGDTHVRLFVQPERDESYAIVAEPSGATRLIRGDGTVGHAGTTSLDCSDGFDCLDTACSGCIAGTKYIERQTNDCFACQVDGVEYCCCVITGTDCGCTVSCDSGGGDTLEPV